MIITIAVIAIAAFLSGWFTNGSRLEPRLKKLRIELMGARYAAEHWQDVADWEGGRAGRWERRAAELSNAEADAKSAELRLADCRRALRPCNEARAGALIDYDVTREGPR